VPAVFPYSPKAYTTSSAFSDWYSVKGYLTNGGSAQTAKKVFRWNAGLNGWYEIWNGRPIVVSSSVTSSNDGTSLTKLTFTGTIDVLNLPTTFTVSVRVSNSNNAWVVIPGTVLTQYGAQSYSLICYGLIDNTSFDYEVTGVNDGGTTKITGSITTNINCTQGATGFVPISVDYLYSEYVGCGICGQKRKVVSRVQYGKPGCSNTYYDPASFPNFDTVDYLSCEEKGVAPSANWVLQSPNSYATSTSLGSVPKNDPTWDVRPIIVKELFGYKWFGHDGSSGCPVNNPYCAYDIRYTVYKCSLTNALQWTAEECFAYFCF
jgi:hypothetical protein